MPTPLVSALRATMRALADPERAAQQQRYMKSELPYYGIAMPVLRKALRAPLAEHPLPDRVAWESAIRELWDQPVAREDRYAALALARHRRYIAFRTDPAVVPLLSHLITTGAWWDVCDETAQHLVAPLLDAHRPEVEPVIRAWMHDDDPWLRRVAVQAQLGLKGHTDPALLADAVEASLADTTFWLRKAIGWALRDYSATDPDWVRAFVASHPELSGLSRREALRKLPAAAGRDT